MMPCAFSELDRTSAYAKAYVLGDVGRIFFIGPPKVSVTADCDPGSGIFKWIVQSVSW